MLRWKDFAEKEGLSLDFFFRTDSTDSPDTSEHIRVLLFSISFFLIEIAGLRKILRVSWTAKKTNEWVLNKAGVKRELLDTVKARKLAYYSRTMRKQLRELPGERDNARNNARCTKARKSTHSLDGQHQDVDRTLRARVNQNDRGQR